VACPVVAFAGPAEDFKDAENTFLFQDYDEAVKKLDRLLHPRSLLDPVRDLKAREYLGASLWWLNQKPRAETEFSALLARRPTHQLDPVFYPPAMIKDFEALRQRLTDLGLIKPEIKPDIVAPKTVVRVRVVERRAFGLSFIPLGVGQFNNGENGKGAFFLGSQLLTGLASASLYVVNRDAGLLEGRKSTSLEVLQIGAGAAFWGLALWGVIDAVTRWRPGRVVQETTEDASPAPPPAGPAKPPGGPLLTPLWGALPGATWAGLGLGVAF